MRIPLLVSLVLLGLPVGVRAQEPGPDPVQALQPYLDDSTIAAGILDVANVDVAALAAALTRAGAPKGETAQLKQTVDSLREALGRAGGRQIGFVFELTHLTGSGPLYVIPTAGGGKPQEIAELFAKVAGLTVKVKDGTVLAGSEASIERALRRQATAVPELSQAFASVAALPTRIVVTVPPALRKSMEEVMPKLPRELGGGSSAIVARGLRWAAIGIDLSAGKQELRVIVQARDAESAKGLARLVPLALQAASRADTPETVAALNGLRPDVKGDQLRLTLSARQLETVVLPVIAKVREAASRTQSMNNLKQLAIAMHNYHDVYKTFPSQASYSPQQKPLLSWRVHLLPYLNQEKLYKQFKLDEPWDSPTNKTLMAKMPAVFRSPHIADAEPGKTTYLVPTGPKLIFNGPKKTKILDIRDGTSNTLMIVEADESRAVWWTQPADLEVNPKMPKAGLLRRGAGGFLAAVADGSVRFMSQSIPDATLWLYFDPADDMAIPEQ